MIAPGQVENIEPVWLLNGAAVATTNATVTLREWSTGAARYWTGTAWSGAPTTLALTSGRYLLTVPTAWLGLVVEVICSLAGYPDLTDELVVDDTVTSREPGADPRLADLDATISSRATPADVHTTVTVITPSGSVS